jgi:hypothetical protein
MPGVLGHGPIIHRHELVVLRVVKAKVISLDDGKLPHCHFRPRLVQSNYRVALAGARLPTDKVRGGRQFAGAIEEQVFENFEQ